MRTPRFSTKLDELPATLELVAAFDPIAIATSLTRASGRFALAIGSGGSLVAAEFLARCRDTLGLGPTSVATPMTVVSDHYSLKDAQVWLFSAGANNPDAIAAARAAADRGCTDLNLITRNGDGQAAAEVRRIGGFVHVLPVADVKDGYLATHSLLSMVVGLLLASTAASREPVGSTEPLEAIAARLTSSSDRARRERLAEAWRSLRSTDTLIVSSDPLLKPVASLLDTSLWEASLCPVQTTDFRNLAHGRHAWLHHRTDQSVILALTGTDSRPAWSAIRDMLPNNLRHTSMDYGRCGRLENVLGIIDGLGVIEAIGEAVGVDPGKPGIGDFGRAIYDDRSLEKLAGELPTRVRHKRSAIAKADALPPDEPSLAAIGLERLRALAAADVGGAVFDYDGTLVATDNRFALPDNAIIKELVRLYRAGLKLGIATGRGGSVGEDLGLRRGARSA